MRDAPAASAAIQTTAEPSARRATSTFAYVLVLALLASLALSWAKWLPYADRLAHLWSGHAWTGRDLFAKAGAPGSAPSLEGAWRFMRAYADAVWMALVAALVIAAAIEALLPRRWLLAPARCRGELRRSLVGGLAALPTLMCTCCSAPLAVTLRRQGVPRATVLAYWIGNPVLNPAVLGFLALVAPWQWVATRIVAGCALVFGATWLVSRLAGPEPDPEPTIPAPAFQQARAPARFLKALLRLSVTLLPEYLVVVFLLGLLRGWIFPLGAGTAHWGVLVTLAAAVLGTAMVIPTAGEIPILQGLAVAGVGSGPIGALLITLPAISLVSMAMVVRVLSARVTVAMAGAVVACGVLAGALMWALGG